MRFLTALLLAFAFVVSPLAAQQTGDANRDYSINGGGSLGTSPVQTTVPTPATSMTNTYATLDPNAPVIWGMATSSMNNWAPGFSVNSIDLGPAGLTFIVDGTSPSGPLSMFANTNPGGVFELTVPTTNAMSGGSLDFGFLHLSAGSPDGFYMSQVHSVTFLPATSPVPNGLATNLALGDDQSSNQALGFNFTFYGTSYTSVDVWSNGSLEFANGATSGGFNFNAPQFTASGAAEIAVVASDLNPSQGGAVLFYTDNAGTAQVTWDGVPEYFNTGSVTAQATLMSSGQVDLSYGLVSDTTFIMGLSGGTASGLLGTPIDFTLSGGNSFATPDSIYEEFQGAHDVDYRTFVIFLDAMGYPVLQI